MRLHIRIRSLFINKLGHTAVFCFQLRLYSVSMFRYPLHSPACACLLLWHISKACVICTNAGNRTKKNHKVKHSRVPYVQSHQNYQCQIKLPRQVFDVHNVASEARSLIFPRSSNSGVGWFIFTLHFRLPLSLCPPWGPPTRRKNSHECIMVMFIFL